MNNRVIMTMLASLCFTACAIDESVDDETEDDVGIAQDEIIGGEYATTAMRKRAVDLGDCTGTLISPTRVLTASHCLKAPGDTARGYPLTSIASDPANPRTITAVAIRPGVAPHPIGALADYTDEDGDFADIAILTLDDPFPFETIVATMAWQYAPTTGNQVGCGRHEDEDNDIGTLLYASNLALDATDAGGDFLTFWDRTDHGDSGGPFYDPSMKVIGALWGSIQGQNKYTSVPRHLAWILSTIGWTWPYGSVQSNLSRQGTVHSTFSAKSHSVCQYACTKTSACVAYNYGSLSKSCTLLSSVSGTTTYGAFSFRWSAAK